MKAALPLSHWPSWALEIRKKKKRKKSPQLVRLKFNQGSALKWRGNKGVTRQQLESVESRNFAADWFMLTKSMLWKSTEEDERVDCFDSFSSCSLPEMQGSMINRSTLHA